ncbi:hypothetical protein ABID29_001527 [Streptococcus rupicaprae]|uniref:Uncharacterized protein n=1 Tax=Streptococcus rupicaprae TaxID=759619 RepID=A0ABV2FIK6_9STRE
MKLTVTSYQKLLFRYLIGYWLIQVLLAVFLLLVERGWGGFAYVWLFIPHLPVFLVGTIFSFLGKKTQNRWVWLTAAMLFILSNAWWIYSGLQGEGFRVILYFIPLTFVPIFATVQLARLTKHL